MRFTPERREAPRIDISALVDVIFLLIIFFAVSTTFIANTGLTVRPPASSTAGAAPTGIEVTVARDGAVQVGETTVPSPEVARRLPELIAREFEESGAARRVVVRGDEGVEYGVLFRALDAVREAGVDAFVLATRPRGAAAEEP